MSVAELKERHLAATQTVSALRDQLKQKRLLLLDTDGWFAFILLFFFFAIYLLV